MADFKLFLCKFYYETAHQKTFIAKITVCCTKCRLQNPKISFGLVFMTVWNSLKMNVELGFPCSSTEISVFPNLSYSLFVRSWWNFVHVFTEEFPIDSDQGLLGNHFYNFYIIEHTFDLWVLCMARSFNLRFYASFFYDFDYKLNKN